MSHRFVFTFEFCYYKLQVDSDIISRENVVNDGKGRFGP